MNFKSWLAVLLPLGFMVAWVGQLAWGIRSGREITLEIKGYDPRDLLSGHYLRYQVEWGGKVACTEPGGAPVCYCLTTDTPATAFWAGGCDDKPQHCDLFVRGRCQHKRFRAGLSHFYIPEKWQGDLSQIPPQATLQIVVGSAGQVMVKSLNINGQPLDEWVKGHPESPDHAPHPSLTPDP